VERHHGTHAWHNTWYTMIASSMMYAIQDGWIDLTNGMNSDKHINGGKEKNISSDSKKLNLSK
jgi:hypothetical protein